MLRKNGQASLWLAVLAAMLGITGIVFSGADDSASPEYDLEEQVYNPEEQLAPVTMGPVYITTTTTTETTTTETTTTTTTTTAETTTATTPQPEVTIGELPLYDSTETSANQTPDAHGLTAEDYAFLSDTVFVGDSICSGLRVYGILPDDNVVAKGCVAARNIFEYTFDVRGSEIGVAYALSVLKPRYVVFSMGMNDINMTTPEVYCENYDNLMQTIRSVLPNTVFYVASITPIAADSEFSSNERIDLFNATMKAHLEGTGSGFVDVASGLKTWGNALNPVYSGGDGIHLAPDAYYVYLNQLCDQLVDTDTVGGYRDGVAYGWAKTMPQIPQTTTKP